MLLFLATVGALASQGDLVTAEERAAARFTEKQVKWRGLFSRRPAGGGAGGGEAARSPRSAATGLCFVG